MASQAQLNVRKTQRTALTKFIANVEVLDKATMTREEHAQFVIRLREIKSNLESNHLDIVTTLTDEDEAEREAEDHQKQLDKVFNITRFLAGCETKIVERESQLREKKESDMIIKTANAQAAAAAANPASQPIHMKLAKLPDSELPKFSGKYDEWLTFSDRFKHTIHNRRDLSGAEKLKYLQAALQGEASKIIRTLPITDSNYQPAWDQIEAKYLHQREIVFNHLDSILDHPDVPSGSISALEGLMIDCNNSVQALKTLGRVDDLGQDFIVKIILRKMDPETRREFKKSLPDTDVPSLKTLNDFINKVVADHATEASTSDYGLRDPSDVNSKPRDRKAQSTSQRPARRPGAKCSFCQEDHFNYSCKKLLDKSANDRLTFVKDHKVCTNCLSPNHTTKDCPSKKTCKKCERNHHTLLHKDSPNSKVSANTAQTSSTNSQTILATAMVLLKNKYEVEWECRALIDNGSTHTFINSSLVNTLGLKRETLSNPMEVKGLSDTPIITITHQVKITMSSNYNPDTTVVANALIVEKASGLHPHLPVNPRTWTHIQDLTLADPEFHKTRAVNLLIGADYYPRIMHEGMKKGKINQPMAQESMFGWIISGPTLSTPSDISVCMSSTCCLDEALKKFWEIEDCATTTRMLTQEEKLCEVHYSKTTSRRADGSFEVQLPFKTNAKALGNSLRMATKRFHNLEAKLNKNPKLKAQYTCQVNELLRDHHLQPIPQNEIALPDSQCYYLPHHGVIKESSSTTKLRIVFDASAATSSGESLNQQLLVGPTLQEDLTSILIRWRFWRVPMTADIKQMYLYIWVKEQHRNFLRLLWRESPTHPLRHFRLAKVTFGTSCAPYQAVKTLQHLGQLYAKEFPLASVVVARDFYVDDCMTGANSEEEAMELQNQLLKLTLKGGFTLRKWSSSSQQVLYNVPESMRETQVPLSLNKDDVIKALGLIWHPATDDFRFQVCPPKSPKITKRTVLSEISRIYDPLGFISPVTIRGKLLMQKLWISEQSWDTVLPPDLRQEWLSYQEELMAIDALRIPRWISQALPNVIQLHGFSDASSKAYAAVIYLRTVNQQTVSVQLIASKNRVAPIKSTSIPRLELCAAELLSNLMDSVRSSLPIQVEEIFGWSDSTVVLHWIQSAPRRWETFVANRVTKIQLRIPPKCWFHVSGVNNPADLPSRGISVESLLSSPLWFHGPDFLHHHSISFPLDATTQSSLNVDPLAGKPREDAYTFLVNTPSTTLAQNPMPPPVQPSPTTALTTEIQSATCHLQSSNPPSIVSKYSSYSKLIRHTAWWIRLWIHLTRRQTTTGPLTFTELQHARNRWIHTVQRECLSAELDHLKAKGHVQRKSGLKQLSPYVDSADGLLKAGGRLQHAKLPEESKHPVILPHHHLTKLIATYHHLNLLHAGPTLLWHMVRRQFWIIRGKTFMKAIVSRCKTCVIQRAEPVQQLMANLPKTRVTPSRPFNRTGVDYAGPVIIRSYVKASERRGAPRSHKAYIVVFICFATKAVHLDLVTDLTTDSFIAAFRRFVSRRGLPQMMFSDNGTNFVGASRELRELWELVGRQEHNHRISKYLEEEGTRWYFNPPAAPHMGGLWEAAVKSAKFHLKRVLGSTPLTYEEHLTVLLQVEACLNSRPLCNGSESPDDLAPLTPGHFLIGAPLRAIPEHDFREEKVTRLSRWQHCQQITQHFWNRWSNEYLHNLLKRTKWTEAQANIKEGELVVLIEENTPPQRWKLGRITDVHHNPCEKSDLIRTVTVRTAEGLLKRPISKLCRIPQERNEVK